MSTETTQYCDCCDGDLPMTPVLDSLCDQTAECDGSVGPNGRCLAVDDDAWDLHDMCVVLEHHGSMFAGNNVVDTAQDWIDHEFSADEADEWCELGVWDASTAAKFRDAELAPNQVASAAIGMVDGLETPDETYTNGDPIYATCNGDLDPQVIIDAA